MTDHLTTIKDMTAVFNIKDMALYQENSVVSREIVRKPTGTVTVFAFDQGESLSEHTAPFDALVYLLEGEAQISIDRKPYVVKEGQMIMMPAKKPHALMALTKFKMLLIMIKQSEK